MKKEHKKEFYKIVNPILKSKEFQKRKNFPHHGEESVYDHSIKVALKAFKMAKKFKLDAKSVAVGAILHDFYTTPWMTDNKKEKCKFNKQHGFVHAKVAYENAKIYFPNYLNPKIKDIITKHMWPLNIKLPKYKETWVVTLSDKLVSLSIFKKPKELPYYLGLKKRKPLTINPVLINVEETYEDPNTNEEDNLELI